MLPPLRDHHCIAADDASASDQSDIGNAAAPGLRSYWTVGRVARFAISILLAGAAVYIVVGKRDELAGASAYLDDLHWYWLVIAVAAEVLSIVCFAALQQRLLAAGRVRMGLLRLTGITFAGNAIENSLPGGPLFSAVFAFRQFRRRGADDVLSGWTLVGATALSQISLIVLALLGLAAAEGTGSAFDLIGVIVGLVVLAALLVVAWSRLDSILRHLVRPLRLVQRLFHRPHGDARELLEEAVRRIRAITPSATDWAVAGSFAMSNWALDCCCLIASFQAVGAAVPWRALILAYGAAQLAANLPITPGGLGVVEGSLAIALVAYGGGEAATVAAVLVYRLISFWGLLPAGWTAWALVNWDARRRRPAPPLSLLPSAAEAGP